MHPQNIKSCPPKSRLTDNILIFELQPRWNGSINSVINGKYKRNIKVDILDQTHGKISHLGEMEDTNESKDQLIKQVFQPLSSVSEYG